MEKRNRLEVLKLSDGDYMRRLESAITFGLPVVRNEVELAARPHTGTSG